ncbi:GyrI-like domain-containing protein [Paenibacillus timonensis]|uniref:GyrI-like domain-containing protein n=1 Tax=Paenibacillus timonensis TaxID=225915 RepID=A0ABW3SDC4_9BACL|nr:GyrI-like domain-containing protein [Paenibacillus timonensis]MCH1642298.1 GyrI-like domain-containing protein [Paenibacillus timonensis]
MEDKLDFKKKDKALYMPGPNPVLVEVPPMLYLMVDGKGDPDGEGYQLAVQKLYTLSYEIKMSKMGEHKPVGYYEYVVPPLEGLWDSEGIGYDPNRNNWVWTSMVRQPEFVTEDLLDRVKERTAKKKPELDLSDVRLSVFKEGLCVQMMHLGPFKTEPESVARMAAFLEANGLEENFDDFRKHHEIYLSDPRKTAPEKMKTVLRHPVRRISPS